MRRIELMYEQFQQYHQDNPDVWGLFCEFADAMSENRTHYGAHTIIHRIRWHVDIQTVSEDEFKINNNHAAFYARLYMLAFPHKRGFFRLRQQRGRKELWLQVQMRELLNEHRQTN